MNYSVDWDGPGERDREPSVQVIPLVQRCPVCGGEPDIDRVADWPRDAGPQPWYAGCYKMVPIEHFVGVNGDTRLETVNAWNAEVAKIEAMAPAGAHKR